MKVDPVQGALRELDRILVDEAERIEDLLAYHRNQVMCPVYTSVDIRRNRHKAAVVDANAYPAGFNNLSERSYAAATEAVKGYMHKVYPDAQDILILGESHTRNKWYFQNLRTLRDLFSNAGYDVTLGTMAQELFPQANVETAMGQKVDLHGVIREGDVLVANGVVHDVVVLNNDLSGGTPDILDDLSQPITPPPEMGWHRRRKSEHFRIVCELARQLGDYAGFDPWLISAQYVRVEDVDFKRKENLESVAEAVDGILAEVAAKYDEYGVDREPHVFVKADAGTYGMGVMTATSGKEFLALNSKGREKMAKGKEGVATTSVIVQEGVHSSMRAVGSPSTAGGGQPQVGSGAAVASPKPTAGGGQPQVGSGSAVASPKPTAGGGQPQAGSGAAVAEPVMYMVCGRVVGGFNRIHAKKTDTESLNAPGSTFQPMAFTTQFEGEPGKDEVVLDEVSRHVYQTIGEIASIATGYELRFAKEFGAPLPQYP